MTATRDHRPVELSERTASPSGKEPLPDLLGRLGSDMGDLLNVHVQLASLEIRNDLEQRARAGALYGAAGVTALLGVLLLSFAAAWGLAEVMPTGFAFLIVGAVYAVVATVLFIVARNRMEEADATPHETIATIQEDVTWARQQTS
jgi:uncharacterized membrane protein YqjE